MVVPPMSRPDLPSTRQRRRWAHSAQLDQHTAACSGAAAKSNSSKRCPAECARRSPGRRPKARRSGENAGMPAVSATETSQFS